MIHLRAGFARGEAFSAVPRSSSTVLAAVLVLAGCASPHPAPIVHRSPLEPVVSQPAAPAPAAVPPGVAAAGAGAPAVESGVQTTPIARGPVETRPLPGVPAGTGTAPAAADVASANLLKTEPRALKQPYSDAALARMRAAAPPAPAPVPPVASAAPSVGATTRASPQVPARVLDDPAAPAASAAAGEWIWPTSGQVVQDFAQPRSMGIAIAGRAGDPIVAVNDGRVIFSGAGPRSYGNLVIVKHGDETLSVYAHNRALLVKEGQSVKRGQRIAELGSSGTDSPKLHFEIRKDGRPIDPRTVLPAR